MTYLEVIWVQVSFVFISGFVSILSVLDDGVQQLFKHLIGLLISCHTALRHKEGVVWNGHMENQFDMQIDEVSLEYTRHDYTNTQST